MIFTKDLTLRDVVNIIHEQVGEDYRFIYRTECYDDHVVLNEANIDQDELGICYKQKASRFVMITGSSNSKHHGRMKVSARGIPINRTNKDKYISIYRKNKNTITFEGSLRNIKMSSYEYEMYIDLFLRNEELIQYANTNPENEKYIDAAFIRDENLRHLGAVVKRSRDTGDAVIYYQDGTIKYENIKGEEMLCY